MSLRRNLLATAAALAAALPAIASAQHQGAGHHRGHQAAAADGAACGGPAPCAQAAPPAKGKPAARVAAQVVSLEMTGEGFVPATAAVKAGRPVKLVVTRKTERTCATDIVVKEYGISRPLPLGQAVEVTFTPRRAGPIRYACAMDMVAGTLVAE